MSGMNHVAKLFEGSPNIEIKLPMNLILQNYHQQSRYHCGMHSENKWSVTINQNDAKHQQDVKKSKRSEKGAIPERTFLTVITLSQKRKQQK